MDRVSVVGNSGSGKTTLARRLAGALGVPFVELDSLYHQPGWVPRDDSSFRAEIARVTAGERWVVDGNYRRFVVEGPVWARADTVVWLNPPRRTVMRQVTRRTLGRMVMRRELWNGNREPFTNFYRWDPDHNILRWAWTNHAKYEARYRAAMADPRWSHLRFVELRSWAEADAWLASEAA